jgi:hypothetical protein
MCCDIGDLSTEEYLYVLKCFKASSETHSLWALPIILVRPFIFLAFTETLRDAENTSVQTLDSSAQRRSGVDQLLLGGAILRLFAAR